MENEKNKPEIPVLERIKRLKYSTFVGYSDADTRYLVKKGLDEFIDAKGDKYVLKFENKRVFYEKVLK